MLNVVKFNVVKHGSNDVKLSTMKLSREAVIRAALELLDEVGLDGLTLRGIATRLGVQAPALYWHVKNKRELIDEMATAILHEALSGMPLASEHESWADWLAELARGYRAMTLRYRDGGRVLSGAHTPAPELYRMLETVLRVLTEAGFSAREGLRAITTLISFVSGFVIEEQALQAIAERRLAEDRPDPLLFPLLSSGNSSTLDSSISDETFEYGLKLLLDGMRVARLS